MFLFTESVTTDEPIPVLPHVALLSIQATSPERRFTQKEIIAGEERPKYLLMKQHQDAGNLFKYKMLTFNWIFEICTIGNVGKIYRKRSKIKFSSTFPIKFKYIKSTTKKNN